MDCIIGDQINHKQLDKSSLMANSKPPTVDPSKWWTYSLESYQVGAIEWFLPFLIDEKDALASLRAISSNYHAYTSNIDHGAILLHLHVVWNQQQENLESRKT